MPRFGGVSLVRSWPPRDEEGASTGGFIICIVRPNDANTTGNSAPVARLPAIQRQAQRVTQPLVWVDSCHQVYWIEAVIDLLGD